MPDETYYSLLSVSETASAADIKAAYLALIREVHPDRLANAPAYWQRQAEEKSKEINEAYTVLSNREKRGLYDAQLATYRGPRPTVSQPSNSQSPDSPPPKPKWQGSQASPGPQAASRASNQPPNARINGGQRFFFAIIGSIFAFGAAEAFWTSSSIADAAFPFLLAAIMSFGVACLFQRQINRMFTALRIRPRQHLWVTIAVILFVLFIGKIANSSGPAPAASIPAVRLPSLNVREQQPTDSGFQQAVTKSSPLAGPPHPDIFDAAAQSRQHGRAQQPSLAVVPAAALVVTPVKAAPEVSETLWRKSLHGKWVGKYTCAQGVTGLTLTIADSPDGGLSGTFDFYPLPGGQVFQEGSYSGTMTAGPDNAFEFTPQKWISQPLGFSEVALSGRYFEGTQQLQGRVTAAGCSSFELSRQPHQAKISFVPQDISSLSASDQASIQSACNGTRLVDGAASYHRCLDAQMEQLARYPSAPDLSSLSAVDRSSIQSACNGTRLVDGAALYHRCLNAQLEQLTRYPSAPDLSTLSAVDRSSIQSACNGTRLVDGAASYHRCLDAQMEQLARYPSAPDLSSLSAVDRSSIQSACNGTRLVDGAASYHRCLSKQLSELNGR